MKSLLDETRAERVPRAGDRDQSRSHRRGTQACELCIARERTPRPREHRDRLDDERVTPRGARDADDVAVLQLGMRRQATSPAGIAQRDPTRIGTHATGQPRGDSIGEVRQLAHSVRAPLVHRLDDERRAPPSIPVTA
jgi:hypothetical protein